MTTWVKAATTHEKSGQNNTTIQDDNNSIAIQHECICASRFKTPHPGCTERDHCGIPSFPRWAPAHRCFGSRHLSAEPCSSGFPNTMRRGNIAWDYMDVWDSLCVAALLCSSLPSGRVVPGNTGCQGTTVHVVPQHVVPQGRPPVGLVLLPELQCRLNASLGDVTFSPYHHLREDMCTCLQDVSLSQVDASGCLMLFWCLCSALKRHLAVFCRPKDTVVHRAKRPKSAMSADPHASL